jgi:hypothetical protein
MRLYCVPGPHPPLPRHIIPGPRWAKPAEDTKQNANAINPTKNQFFFICFTSSLHKIRLKT